MTVLNKRYVVLLLLWVLACVDPVYCQQKVGEQEARMLAYEAVRGHDPRHEVNISRVDNRYDRDFIYFEATWPNPAGSQHLGNFAVNPWTGTVYDADSCEVVTSASLKKLQDSIRKRLNLRQGEYAKLQAKKPICEAR